VVYCHNHTVAIATLNTPNYFKFLGTC